MSIVYTVVYSRMRSDLDASVKNTLEMTASPTRLCRLAHDLYMYITIVQSSRVALRKCNTKLRKLRCTEAA